MSIAELIAAIDLRFQSGNGVPVSRAAIKSDEWQQIRDVLAKATGGTP